MDFVYGRPIEARTGAELLDQIPDREFDKVTRSTVPLLQLWLTDAGRAARAELLEKLGTHGTAIRKAAFEYTVPANCRPCSARGKVSCTDLLLHAGRDVLAIEAKYREQRYPLVRKWRTSTSKKDNADAVLAHWVRHAIGMDGPVGDNYDHLVYQLVHRTASACTAAGEAGRPVVVLLLFSDAHRDDYSAAMSDLAAAFAGREPKISFRTMLVQTKPDEAAHAELTSVRAPTLRAETLRAWLRGGRPVYSFGRVDEVHTSTASRPERRRDPEALVYPSSK